MDRRASTAPITSRCSTGSPADRPAPPLRVLADAVRGAGTGPAARGSQYTTETPLNRLVDAARPESESIRALEQAAAKAAANPAAESGELHRAFAAWAANDAAFEALAKDNALLGELQTFPEIFRRWARPA